MRKAADTDQGRLEFDQDKEAAEQKQQLETNRVGRLLPFMNADFTGLDPKFFERDQNGRLVNKTEIFDLINQNSALLILETAPGQFVDNEVGGLDYD